MSSEYPAVIDLVETDDGVFLPGVVNAPTTGAIVPYRPAAVETYRPAPQSIPRYQSGSQGLSDSDLRDFGTDSRGRPQVVRNPRTGRAEWNPEIDYEGPSFEGNQRRRDVAVGVPDSRQGRRLAGRSMRTMGRFQAAFDIANFQYEMGNAIADDLQEAAGIEQGWFRDWALDRAREFDEHFGLEDFWGPQPGSPTGVVAVAGPAEFPGGQCPAPYSITAQIRLIRQDGSGTNPGTVVSVTEFTGTNKQIYGPIEGPIIVKDGNRESVRYKGQDSNGNTLTGSLFNSNVGTIFTTEVVRFEYTRLDGLADNCGDGQGPTTETPTTPRTTPGTDYPPSYPEPDYPNLPRLPEPPGDYQPPETPEPEYPDLPEVPELPEQPETPEPPDAPTPDPDCCPSTERSLDSIKSDLNKILEKLAGSGDGKLDLSPCDADESVEAEYSGEGLQGVYSAIAAIEKSLNFISGNTKCSDDIAALPMFYELKHGEIAQLVVVWKKVETDGSAWSMTIPHPRENVDKDFQFNFPDYLKGGNLATVRLTDNSQIRLNVFSLLEAEKVIGYISTLLDPAYVPETGLSITYSENVANYAEVLVKAEYVKRFKGHKTTVPVWGRRILT